MKKLLFIPILLIMMSGCVASVRAGDNQVYKVTIYTPNGQETYIAEDYTPQDGNSLVIKVNGKNLLYNGVYKIEVVRK